MCRTVPSFRSRREVDDLWNVVIRLLNSVIEHLLVNESEPDSFLRVKEYLLSFNMTLQVSDE